MIKLSNMHKEKWCSKSETKKSTNSLHLSRNKELSKQRKTERKTFHFSCKEKIRKSPFTSFSRNNVNEKGYTIQLPEDRKLVSNDSLEKKKMMEVWTK